MGFDKNKSKVITADEFKKEFGKYLDFVLKQHEIIITNDDSKVARLIPYITDIEQYNKVKEKAVDYQYGGRKVSYEEFMGIYEKSSLRMEFINGEIYVLASPVISHQEVLGRLYIIFNDYFKGKKCRTFLAPFDVHFNKKGVKEPDVMQPDLLVACDLEDNVNEKDRYMGTPTLVIEVLSDSTKDKDMIKKLNTYKLSGVEEYWIVNHKQKNIMVYHFENLEIDKYRIYGEADTASSDMFKGLFVNIKDLFNELV